MGRALAERLGYLPADLDRIPPEAIDSFAGVGHYFHLADLKEGETVVDLGSGSGTDSFIATLKVGARGKVFGIDMTDEQRAKAERLRVRDGFMTVKFLKGYIEEVPLPDGTADAVISNGVINLATDKPRVFREAARLLKPGGRLALADIITETQLPDTIVCNSTLWAACIGGAADLERSSVSQFLFEGHRLDLGRRELRRGSEQVMLEPQVFDLIAYLVKNRDRVLTKDDLIAAVWEGRIVSASTLTSRINFARKAGGACG